MKAWQLRIDDYDDVTVAWADSSNQALLKIHDKGTSLDAWYIHDLSNKRVDVKNVNVKRLPLLDNMEKADPKEIIKILAKNYGWVSDQIYADNVDDFDFDEIEL